MDGVNALWSPSVICDEADAQEDRNIEAWVAFARDPGDEHKEDAHE